MRRIDPRDGFWSSSSHERPAFIAGLRSEIDHPVGALDHLEVVFDHDDGVASLDQSLKQPHEDRDIVEMQASRRLVENEEIAPRGAVLFRADTLIGQMPDEFEPLRFTAGKRVERLAEPQLTEPSFIENIERTA